MAQLLLASASPARAATLRAAGIAFDVRVSDVDEHAVLDQGRRQGTLSPVEQVGLLARAKAHAVAGLPEAAGKLVLGCDSMFEIDGQLLGKPASAAEARARIGHMAGRSGLLHTGHHLIDRRHPVDGAGRAVDVTASASASATTRVHFGPMTPAEIDAYVATGEPLQVAGSFTIDALGGPFIDGIEGDHHNVVGLSLPTLRRLLGELGVFLPDLWRQD